MAFFDRKPKNQNVQQEEKNYSPDVNEQYEEEEEEIVDPVSNNVRPEIINFVVHEMETWNIPFEISENGNSYRLVIDRSNVDEVREIIEDGEKAYFQKLKEAEDANAPKKSLNAQVGGATEEIENKQPPKPRILQREINPEFEKEYAQMLLNAGMKQFNFRDFENKRYVIFYETDREIVHSTYEKLLVQILKTEEEPEQTNKKSETKSESSKKKATKKVLGRTEQIMTRLTPDEMKLVQERIEMSGKRQGDFMREMLLDGYVKAFPTHANDLTIIQELQNLSSQLGKISGAIVKIMQETKDNSVLSEEERSNLQREINGLKKLRTEIRKEVKELWH